MSDGKLIIDFGFFVLQDAIVNYKITVLRILVKMELRVPRSMIVTNVNVLPVLLERRAPKISMNVKRVRVFGENVTIFTDLMRKYNLPIYTYIILIISFSNQ